MKQTTSTNKAFTLIEILVVVLIIGILAAIAVPQYQKSVAKSAAQELVIQGRALMTAQSEYFLANGSFAKDLSALSLTFPNNSWECFPNYCQNGSLKYSYGVTFEVTNNFTGDTTTHLTCIAYHERAMALCESIGGKYSFYNDTYSTHYYTIYEK